MPISSRPTTTHLSPIPKITSEVWLLSFSISGIKNSNSLMPLLPLILQLHMFHLCSLNLFPRVATWSIFPCWNTSTLSIRLNYPPYSLPGDQEFGKLLISEILRFVPCFKTMSSLKTGRALLFFLGSNHTQHHQRPTPSQVPGTCVCVYVC